jgi:hypothetical protein
MGIKFVVDIQIKINHCCCGSILFNFLCFVTCSIKYDKFTVNLIYTCEHSGILENQFMNNLFCINRTKF